MKNQDPFIGLRLLDTYTVLEKLGEGSFGRIYKATSSSESVALKIEKHRPGHSLLENESLIMSAVYGRKYY